jgi:hypothetical protein
MAIYISGIPSESSLRKERLNEVIGVPRSTSTNSELINACSQVQLGDGKLVMGEECRKNVAGDWLSG